MSLSKVCFSISMNRSPNMVITAVVLITWAHPSSLVFAGVHNPTASSYDDQIAVLRDELTPIDTRKSEAQATLAIVREELERDPQNMRTALVEGLVLSAA